VNFPKVHGARIAAAPDPELAAAEARLAALDDDQVVDVDPVWVESVVEKVAAGRVPVQKGRLRRIAAAAVAFFALHGFATAATVTVVTAATVTAVVLWPEGRNSNETMSYDLTLRLLLREDQPEEDRASAMFQIVRRVRGAIDALRLVQRTDGVDQSVQTAAVAGLQRIGECLAGRWAVPTVGDFIDPLPTVEIVRSPAGSQRFTIADVELCVVGACRGVWAMHAMPPSNARLVKDREVLLRRLGEMAVVPLRRLYCFANGTP